MSNEKHKLANWRLTAYLCISTFALTGCSSAPNLGNLINSVEDFTRPITFKFGPNQFREAIVAENMTHNNYGFLPSNPCPDNVTGSVEGLASNSESNSAGNGFAQKIVNWQKTDDYLSTRRFAVHYQYQGQAKPPVSFRCTTFSDKLKELKSVSNAKDPSISDSLNIVIGHRVLKDVVFSNSYEINMPIKYTVYRGSFSYRVENDILPVKFEGEGHGEIEIFKDPRTTRWTLASFTLVDPHIEIDPAVLIDDSGGDCPGTSAKIAALSPLARGELAALGLAKKASVAVPMEFSDADGKRLSLADFRGRALLLNLWATWCVPCRTELVKLDHLQAEAGSADFQVLAVNVDTKQSDAAAAFLDEIGARALAHFADSSAGPFQALRDAGKAMGLPTSVLIDKQGCELGIVSGPANWDGEAALKLVDLLKRN